MNADLLRARDDSILRSVVDDRGFHLILRLANPEVSDTPAIVMCRSLRSSMFQE